MKQRNRFQGEEEVFNSHRIRKCHVVWTVVDPPVSTFAIAAYISLEKLHPLSFKSLWTHGRELRAVQLGLRCVCGGFMPGVADGHCRVSARLA